MRLLSRTALWVSLASCVAASASAASPGSADARWPGLQRDGSVLLPNQWSLRPAGKQIPVGDFPVNIALHPKGRYAAVLHCGYSQHEVRILDLNESRVVSQVALAEAFYRLAWSPDGKTLYTSGASQEVVQSFAFAAGLLSSPHELRLRPKEETGLPTGLAISGDGKTITVAEGWGQRVVRLNTHDGSVCWSHALAAKPAAADEITDPEGVRHDAADSGAPFPYGVVLDETRGRVYVSLWAQATVLALDANSGAPLARWGVGPHPNELLLARDGRLFVAEANLNTVSVLDTETGRVLEVLATGLTPDAAPGSTPNSLALTPDGKTLFVANANNNTVAAFDVGERGHAASLGVIPVGWYPTSVRVSADGNVLIVANGKGNTSAPNPAGPFPGDSRPRDLQEYIGSLFRGTVSLIPLPPVEKRASQFATWTKQALANSPVPAGLRPQRIRPANNPVSEHVGDTSPIQHVIYIVKENRTYDQVFGDIDAGNGDARLCLFPEAVTPNHHALARDFVLLDNVYADGDVSADGHEWTVGAYASDFVEKTWPLNYGHGKSKKVNYPAEGAYAFAAPARGYLWDQAARAGVTYRSYGEFVRNPGKGGGDARPTIPILKDHIDPRYPGFDLEIPDQRRAERFIAELHRFETEGAMPRLQVVRLGNDHTAGTRKGSHTPTAMVADNDLALGQLVEAVSRSRFWATTAIFVLEDDAQNGPDHVDAHRIPALVISPYTARHTVDSTLYSTTSMLRTIELILGLPPMSQYDEAAAPMFTCFTAQPDLTPYATRPAGTDLDARNSALAWGSRQSGRMNLKEADRADDIALNEIVWRSVRGAHAPMPAPVRAAFFRARPKTDDDDN